MTSKLIIVYLASKKTTTTMSTRQSNYGSGVRSFLFGIPLKFELLSISQCHASILKTHGEKKMIGKRDESMIVFSLKAKHFYGGDITTSFHTRGNKHFFLLLVYCRFHRCWAVVGHHCYIMSELMKKLQAMKMSSPLFLLLPCALRVFDDVLKLTSAIKELLWSLR